MSNLISAENYINFSDVIFSAFISKKKVTDYIQSGYEIINETNEFYLVKKQDFTLRENDIIFCNTDLVYELFKLLKPINSLSNIKLVTHQSDVSINMKHLQYKPECISEWYAINVDVESNYLYPIPIGLASSFQEKYLVESNILNINSSKVDKSNLIYINFNPNTNAIHRNVVLEKFIKEDWAKVDLFNVPIDEYASNIQKSHFVLAPWGNGIDTHRIWEALYLGSIPITKYHKTFKSIKELPILFVDSYEEVNKTLLEKYLYENSKNSISPMYYVGFWEELFKKNKLDSTESITISQNRILFLFDKYKLKLKIIFKSKIKLSKYYLMKIIKVLKK